MHSSVVSTYSLPSAAHHSERSEYSPNSTHRSIPNPAARILPAAPIEVAKSEAGPRRAADQPPRMRSSIACARCRRSKVKCVNSGVGTQCRTCETTGRECTYPVPNSSGGHGGKRFVEGGEVKYAGEGILQNDTPKRQRPKKIQSAPTNVSTKESMRALVDALDPDILTPQVWIELFDIWQLHYSTDLPFIHTPTFLKPLRQMQQQGQHQSADFSSPRTVQNSLPPAAPILLMGFLALTARFHEKLVAHHSPPSTNRPSNPLIASQYYASAAKARLAGNAGDGLGLPDGARIQALCMLALHDWGNCHGVKAWISIGVAVRYAQVLGLQYQEDLDDQPNSRTSALALQSFAAPKEDFVEQETRRRTFWSCYIMDRYMSSGKYRPQMLNVRDVRLQLPSSERSFLFGERVRTALLSEEPEDMTDQKSIPGHTRKSSSMHGGSNGDSVSTPRHSYARSPAQGNEEEQHGRWELGASEGIMSRYIKAIDLYGSVVRWSCGGGRRRERHAPWEPQSQWFVLNNRVSNFINSLPRDLALSNANVQAHIASRTSTPYTLLHSVLLLCKVMLHREYLPFAPLRCTRPQGPLDAPFFPTSETNAPYGFWEESAKELFRSARNLIDMVQTCYEWHVLPETPIVGFAIYTVALTGVYSINFPWMDPNGFMSKRPVRASPRETQITSGDDSGAIASRQALRLIGTMRKRLRMADGWFRTISRVHRYFIRIKKDFQRHSRVLLEARALFEFNIPTNLRENVPGGAAEESKIIENALKEFGSLEDEDQEMTDAPDVGENGHAGSSDAASTGVKSEGCGLQERTPESGTVRQDRWNAINSFGPGPQAAPETKIPNGTQAGYYSTPMSGMSSAPTSTTSHANYPQRVGSNLASPPLRSPNAPGPGHFPSHPPQQASEPTLQAHMNLQQQMHAPPAPSPSLSAEQALEWLNSIDTRFTADDVTAFVEGKNWQEWANGAVGSLAFGGWLSQLWTSPQD
ncbi:fungal-specific transcription factor domain-containing protein [Venturia nashicola]|uniref:Fungal-specific transcription factor domain-containing protein n=1 Tax=Venturia nashicola TaxID=86259 RepID=A0A4Z1NZB1_9PEZI|nr:fungal-specific transcription factor domain-containing protein [Venturia nashicola]